LVSPEEKKLNNIKFRSVIKSLASPKLTVICLFLLLIVVIWGTVYQVDYGLYASQQKFFSSWVAVLFGFLPFPGTVLLFWILFVNVLSSLFFRIPLKWSNTGNILTHAGVLIFFVGSFFTTYFSQESMIRLREGERKDYSVSSRNWELAVWEAGTKRKVVYAVDTDRLVSGDLIQIESLGLEIRVLEYHRNSMPLMENRGSAEDGTLNASGIQDLKPEPLHKEPSNNRAGLIFFIENPEKIPHRILLYAGDRSPTRVTIKDSPFHFSLRNKRFLLPFSLGLIDFKKTEYPGSSIVKSYESRVEMRVGELSREVIISMNKPLRYKNFTLYQSSYFIAEDGTEFSFLAVVENFGKIFPYIASTIIFLGLCIHFILMLVRRKRKAKG
jgi:hypothetical protein